MNRVGITLGQSGKLRPALRLRQAANLKQARILEAGEQEFSQLVKAVEIEPLFQKLLTEGGIRRRRFPGVSPAFFRKTSLNEEQTAGAGTGRMADLDEETAALAEKIGREDFVRFFLAPEKLFTFEQISLETGLSAGEIERLADFVNEVSGRGFSGPPESSGVRPSGGLRIIASVVREGGSLQLEDLTFDLVRGLYVFDEDRLESLKETFTGAQKKELAGIISRLSWINSRRSTIYLVLSALLRKQRRFFLSGNPADLEVCTQRRLSRDLGLDPSVVNRVVRRRAVRIPNGRTVGLRDFFTGKREQIVRVIREHSAAGRDAACSDSEISRILLTDYGIRISRRTVCWYRSRLGLGNPLI